MPHGQFAVEQRQAAAVGQRPRRDQPVLEVRLRMRAGEPVGDLAIDERHLLERELVDVVPVVAEAHLVKERPFSRSSRRGSCGVGLRPRLGQPDRRGQRQRLRPRRRRARDSVELDADEQVGARRRVVARALVANACAERVTSKPSALSTSSSSPFCSKQ